MAPKKLKQKVSQRFSILPDIVNDQKKVYQNLTHKSHKIKFIKFKMAAIGRKNR